MNRDLHAYRDSYTKGELLLENTSTCPFEQFSTWFQEVESEGSTNEPNAMTLATFGTDGFPKARVVLLKAFSPEGLVFFTNYESEKGRSISNHPKVGLSFFWPALERQVIFKGTVAKLDTARSNAYFNSRPRDSQLGALVSNQSTETTRQALEQKMEALKEEYATQEILRPSHWGGYLVTPVSVEFWQGRPNRLHDRIAYEKTGNDWTKKRLAP